MTRLTRRSSPVRQLINTLSPISLISAIWKHPNKPVYIKPPISESTIISTWLTASIIKPTTALVCAFTTFHPFSRTPLEIASARSAFSTSSLKMTLYLVMATQSTRVLGPPIYSHLASTSLTLLSVVHSLSRWPRKRSVSQRPVMPIIVFVLCARTLSLVAWRRAKRSAENSQRVLSRTLRLWRIMPLMLARVMLFLELARHALVCCQQRLLYRGILDNKWRTII